jgi:hypothetical protein
MPEFDTLYDKLCEANQHIAKLEAKVLELKEAARWSRWPDEYPDASGRYEICFLAHDPMEGPIVVHRFAKYSHMWYGAAYGVAELYWRPVGELPQGWEVADDH